MPSEWTQETLKQLMDERFRGQEEAIKREREERRERDIKNNEFRGQLADQASKFITRAEVESRFETLTVLVRSESKALQEQVRAKNLQIVAAFGFGLVGTLIAVFNLASRIAGS